MRVRPATARLTTKRSGPWRWRVASYRRRRRVGRHAWEPGAPMAALGGRVGFPGCPARFYSVHCQNKQTSNGAMNRHHCMKGSSGSIALVDEMRGRFPVAACHDTHVQPGCYVRIVLRIWCAGHDGCLCCACECSSATSHGDSCRQARPASAPVCAD